MPIIFGDVGPESLAIFIPIVSIIGGIAVAIVAIVMAGKKKELEHKERLTAMEKGMAIPESPEGKHLLRPAYQKNRTGGLVESICADDFAPIVSDLGLTLSSLTLWYCHSSISLR